MPAGRPHNSITPAWRSKPAVRVCAWKLFRFLTEQETTKSECARELGISRSTVIKWWNTIDWDENFIIFQRVFDWRVCWVKHPEKSFDDCAEELNISVEKVQFMEKIRKELKKWSKYLDHEDYDFEQFQQNLENEENGTFIFVRQKSIWKGHKRWKR